MRRGLRKWPVIIMGLLLTTGPQAAPAPSLDEQIESGLKAYDLGHHAEAQRLLRAALQDAERVGLEDLRVAAILNILTAIDTLEHYGRSGWCIQPLPRVNRALGIAEKILQPGHPDFVQSLKVAADFNLTCDNRDQGEELMNRALAIDEKVLGPEHPEVLVSRLHWRATLVSLRQRGEFAEMESLYRQAMEIQEKAFGPDSPKLIPTLKSLIFVNAIKGQNTHAELLVRRTLAIQEKALGPEHPDIAPTLGSLIGFYADQGKPLEESMTRRTVGFREKALTRGPFITPRPIFMRSLDILRKAVELPGMRYPAMRAVFSFMQGQKAHGEALFNLWLAILADGLGPEHPDVAMNLEHFAKLLREANRETEASAIEGRAKAIRAKHATETPTK